jgi:hypothetical protein
MKLKNIAEKIAIVALSLIIVFGVSAIVASFIFGVKAVKPIVANIFTNEYAFVLVGTLIATIFGNFRKTIRRDNRNYWLQKYGVINAKIKSKIYCSKFNPVSNLLLNIYHITGTDKSGDPFEVYLAVDREWSVKDIIWVTKSIKV